MHCERREKAGGKNGVLERNFGKSLAGHSVAGGGTGGVLWAFSTQRREGTQRRKEIKKSKTEVVAQGGLGENPAKREIG
jgi:hypothetical protein